VETSPGGPDSQTSCADGSWMSFGDWAAGVQNLNAEMQALQLNGNQWNARSGASCPISSFPQIRSPSSRWWEIPSLTGLVSNISRTALVAG
jgi:hypothetical protein